MMAAGLEQIRTMLEASGLEVPAPLKADPGPLKVSVFMTDHAGTPYKLIDQEGKTLWEAEPDDWGAVRNEKGIRQPIRFQGQYHDEETGLYYNRWRYYDPLQGRYITQDPIGLEGGFNLYAYVGGDPLNYIDPLGLWVDGTYNRTTGVLTLHDRERGTTISGPFESGGKPYGDPIPVGSYDILIREGREGFFRLEPLDNYYGNDKHDETGRTHFRLHHPGRTVGCIAATDAKNWSDIEQLINTTKTDSVSVTYERRWYRPWQPPKWAEALTRYGRITVTEGK
jgi:RHS repeat-associated protein